MFDVLIHVINGFSLTLPFKKSIFYSTSEFMCALQSEFLFTHDVCGERKTCTKDNNALVAMLTESRPEREIASE